MGSKPGALAWYGFVVPKGAPQELVDMLQKVTAEAINDATVRSHLAHEVAAPAGNSPQEFGAFIEAEHTRWADIVKTANLALN